MIGVRGEYPALDDTAIPVGRLDPVSRPPPNTGAVGKTSNRPAPARHVEVVMEDYLWTLPMSLLGELEDVVALVVLLAALGLRVHPAARKWAPRGNARVPRPAPLTRGSDPEGRRDPEPSTLRW